jgi:DNA-binding GntR family transcriptional regulator
MSEIVGTEFKTLAEHAYENIRDGILTGALKPGQKLTRKAMAEMTGVSAIPVMEALHRLNSEGLIESRPHFGARVVRLTSDVMKDRYELREAIECHVVRILARALTPAQGEELLTMARETDDLARESPGDPRFWDSHSRFHRRLAELTRCQSLVEVLQKTSLFLILHRAHLAVMLTHGAAENHEEVVKAVMSGDPDGAERAMREHIGHYWAAVRQMPRLQG